MPLEPDDLPDDSTPEKTMPEVPANATATYQQVPTASPPPGNAPNLQSAAQLSPQFYLDSDLGTVYNHNTGIIQVPIANHAVSDCELIAVCAPFTSKTVRWTFDRVGEKPVLPYWATGTANEILLNRTIVPQAPVVEPPGNRARQRVSGSYLFAFKQALAEQDPLPVGVPPTNNQSKSDTEIGYQQFDSAIIDVS